MFEYILKDSEFGFPQPVCEADSINLLSVCGNKVCFSDFDRTLTVIEDGAQS